MICMMFRIIVVAFWGHFELARTIDKSYPLRAEKSGETLETGFDNKNVFAKMIQERFLIKHI